MEGMEEVRQRSRRGNQVLFAKDSACLRDLAELLRPAPHRVAVLWGLELARGSVEELEERYPAERRPREAWEAAWDWASGKIKMRLAQRKILDCHALAKELDSPADRALCHAVGQACAIIHTAGHALGYPIYDLTALVNRLGLEHCAQAVEERRRVYTDRLLYWQEHAGEYRGTWAEFLLK